jgi:predicted adenine nucleotide alpha hydrolase (AANH) superfamily ATPase
LTMSGRRLLLHICCAPCSIYPLEILKRQSHEVVGFFYNPNIHPFLEYKRRLQALREYAQVVELDLHIEDSYDIEPFLKKALEDPKYGSRCAICYEMRLREAAKFAKAGHFNVYSTTLLSSPYQLHDLITRIGTQIGEEEGVKFLYQDFRPGFRLGQTRAKGLGIYRQPYCGCIFSEHERYQKRS